MQRFISAIGFSPHLVTRPVTASGIANGDTVELLRPDQPDESMNERTTNAIEDVRTTLSGVANDVTVESTVITDSDFESIVDQCSQRIVNGSSPVICFGAGSTDIQFPLLLAATAHEELLTETILYSDLADSSQVVELPPLTAQIPGRTEETLQALWALNGAATLGDIAEVTDVDRSTVTRHVMTLEGTGAVTTETTDQNEKWVSLSLFGRLVVRNWDK